MQLRRGYFFELIAAPLMSFTARLVHSFSRSYALGRIEETEAKEELEEHGPLLELHVSSQTGVYASQFNFCIVDLLWKLHCECVDTCHRAEWVQIAVEHVICP